MIPDSNILNNKRSVPSFSVQILSIFTFSRRNKASFSHNPHHIDMNISHFTFLKRIEYDNMNSKTLSEPQNNENDTLDNQDGGHYS